MWDAAAAARAINFFPDILSVDVDGETRPFHLLPWQAFIIGSLFGWRTISTGHRRFLTAYIETGKGSGKSPLAAGVGLYMLTADREPRAEIYAAAAKKDQAMVLFRDAVSMWRGSEKLRARLRASGGPGHEWDLYSGETQSFFRVIASDSAQSGPRPHCALLDEIHEHPDDRVVRLMRAGTKGRRQALIFMITNSGSQRSGVCWDYHQYATRVSAGDALDDAFFAYVCSVDPGDDPIKDESCWAKVNPSIGQTFKPEYLRRLVTESKGMPSSEAIVRRLNFCEWTDAETPWIDRDLWDACQSDFDPEDMRGVPCYLGLDLAQKRDLTAVAACWRHPDDTYSLAAWGWTPGDTAAERASIDSADYPLWAKQGHLYAPPGRIIDHEIVARWVQDFSSRHAVECLAYDTALSDEFMRVSDRIGLLTWTDDRKRNESGVPVEREKPGIRIVRHGQGFLGHASSTVMWMPRSVNALESLIANRKLRIKESPVLRHCSASAVLISDATGNRRFDKRKSTGRIDLIVAAAQAVGAAVLGSPPRARSIWSRDDLWK